MMCLAHSCTIASFFVFHSWLDETKINQKSILIIFSFKIFMNSLSEMVKVFHFCPYSGKSVHARIFNLVRVFTQAEHNDSDKS